jgi:hypothetical protein
MRFWFLVVVFCVAAGVSACGGSASSSGSSGSSSGVVSVGSTSSSGSSGSGSVGVAGLGGLVVRVDGVCARRNRRVAAVGLSVTSEAGLKRIARGRAVIERGVLGELSGLRVPVSFEGVWREFLADRQGVVEAWDRVSVVGLRDNRDKVFREAVRAQAVMLAAAKRAGFKECTQPD